MQASAIIVPGQLAYMTLPAKSLRELADTTFPAFAKCPLADSVSGFNHRWVAGHDLALDLPSTLVRHGPGDAAWQAGHIVLTDFPTRAGIPIPGLSRSGLGQFLVSCGIPHGWLSLNLCGGGMGILAIAEGSGDLAAALAGHLPMGAATFFDTYVEGGLEVTLASYTQNPLMLVGGMENLLAGVVSTWKTCCVYVDPLTFAGSAMAAALVGFGVAYAFLGGQQIRHSLMAGARSGTVGAAYAVAPAFGFGALAGLLAFSLGRKLAETHNAHARTTMQIDAWSVKMFLDAVAAGDPTAVQFYEQAQRSVELGADTNTDGFDAHGEALGCAPNLDMAAHVESLASGVSLFDTTQVGLGMATPTACAG